MDIVLCFAKAISFTNSISEFIWLIADETLTLVEISNIFVDATAASKPSMVSITSSSIRENPFESGDFRVSVYFIFLIP